MDPKIEKNLTVILNTVVEVIRNPTGFFRSMPKVGGFVDPLVFMVSMGIVAGVLQALLEVVGLKFTASFFTAIVSIIIVPVLTAIFGFVGAAILFVIWKIMGSKESFETAYRCAAYANGIVPVTTILGVIPYLGPVIGIVWMTYLMVIASVEVHDLQAKTAWIVFGVICGIFILVSISSQVASRKMTKEMSTWGEKMERMEDMSPKEAGRAMGEFLKGMEKGAGK